MSVTELGIVMEDKLVQNAKALSPMSVTELGIVMEDRLVHLWKASYPILITELGIETDVKSVQFSKADNPIPDTAKTTPSFVMLSGIETEPEYDGLVLESP